MNGPNEISASGAVCRNCGSRLEGPFCHECGQKADDRPTSLIGFLRELVEELFDLRSRSLTSFWYLLFRPGELTKAYFSGQKVRFAQPIQLYLVAAALFFFANSYHPFIGLSPEYKVESRIGLMRTGQQLSTAVIDSLQAQGMSDGVFRERFRSIVSDTLPPFMIGSVILFAFVVWLFHPRRPALYHIVFALHWTAFFLIIMSIERVLFPEWQGSEWIRGALNLLAAVHLTVSLIRVYGYGPLRAVPTGVSLAILFNIVLIVWVLSVGFFAINMIS